MRHRPEGSSIRTPPRGRLQEDTTSDDCSWLLGDPAPVPMTAAPRDTTGSAVVTPSPSRSLSLSLCTPNPCFIPILFPSCPIAIPFIAGISLFNRHCLSALNLIRAGRCPCLWLHFTAGITNEAGAGTGILSNRTLTGGHFQGSGGSVVEKFWFWVDT